jgi:hypothetical protein
VASAIRRLFSRALPQRWILQRESAMERPLADWELGVVIALVRVGGLGSGVVRESVPYLVWTGGCGCGCPSFNVRDGRFPRQPHVLERFSSGHTPDGSVGFDLYLWPDGRPLSVDVETDGRDVRPAPDTLVVARA